MKNKVLLIGNDINNATSNYSWENLLTDLIEYSKLTKAPSSANKPFPMYYEEIFLNSARLYGTEERRLKLYIAAKARKLIPNEIHEEILDLGVKDILTTNYDLTFEEVLTDDPRKLKNNGFIRESLYSLFRTHTIENTKIWHIHGSANAPQSILLGYEQYGGYLQQMRNYVVTGTKGNYAKTEFLPMHQRLKEDLINYESWIDFFFTHDIDIFGLNLDFVEMHLWWLMTYRARAIVTNRIKTTNTIRYFFPKKFAVQSKHKLELLRANEIKTIPIVMNGDNRISYYKKVLKEIKR